YIEKQEKEIAPEHELQSCCAGIESTALRRPSEPLLIEISITVSSTTRKTKTKLLGGQLGGRRQSPSLTLFCVLRKVKSSDRSGNSNTRIACDEIVFNESACCVKYFHKMQRYKNA
ncbi:unnamed protein product, partial [Amoebophrya sp. A120]